MRRLGFLALALALGLALPARAYGDTPPPSLTLAPPVLSVPTSGTATLGRLTLNWGPITGVNLFSVAKDAHGKMTITGPSQGDGGLLLDFGFGQAADGNDRFHVALAAMLGGGVQSGTGTATFTTGVMLGWGGFDKWPLFAVGPAINVPVGTGLPPTFQFLATMACLNFIRELSPPAPAPPVPIS